MDDNKSSGQFPLPGIALVLLALGVFVFSDTTFNPSRPEAPSELTSIAEDVRARLWQDPFEAVETHRRTKHSDDIDEQLKRLKSDSSLNSMYQNQQHRVCDLNPRETITKINKLSDARLRVEKLVYEKAGIEDIRSAKNQVKKVSADIVKTSAHTIGELRCQVQLVFEDSLFKERADQPGNRNDLDLRILAVMVPGGPYAEDKETRIRSRYAVISGLSYAGYIPKDSEHIGYMDFSDLCKRSLEGYPVGFRYCDWPATIPYEWFKSTDKVNKDSAGSAENILILWLDDEEISLHKPLKMLQRLRFALTPAKSERTTRFKVKKLQLLDKEIREIKFEFDVLGPASSTTLLQMYKEAKEVCYKRELQDCITADREEQAAENKSIRNSSYIRIFSPRATVDNVAIMKEVDVIDAASQVPVQWINSTGEDSDDYIDSWFNLKRTIATDRELVENLLCELLRRGVNPFSVDVTRSETGDGCSNFSAAGLNRNGLQDYIVLIGESDTVYSRNFYDLFYQQIKEKSEAIEPAWLLHYNYFRGVDGSIGKTKSGSSSKEEKALDKGSLRRPVGENQYDYLRRLGYQLNDLSASLSDKGTIRAIGIVGSDTYDKLLVLQALRNRFPDAVFFTTDIDARMLHAEENQWARNLVVASGYGLAPEPGLSDGVIAFRDGYQTSMYMATLLATGVVDKATVNPGASKVFEVGNNYAIEYGSKKPFASEGRYLFYGLLLLLLVLLLMYQASDRTRIYILISAAVIYLVAIWVGVFDTENSVEFHQMLSGTSVWPALIMRMSAAVLAVFLIFYALSVLRENTRTLVEQYDLDIKKCMPALNVRMFISAWGCRYALKNDKEGQRTDVRKLMSQYFALGDTKWWFIRVVLMLAVYFILSMQFLFSFPDLPYAPVSDRVSAIAQKCVLFTSVPAYLFLVFFVVDVTRLNARFVSLVSKCKVKWPRKMLDRCRRKYGIGENVAEEKLKLDLIVFRSKAVDTLIFLPFIVLTLMIVSRSTYFDRWHMPLQLAIVILLGACIALSSAIRLRRSAKMVRANALEKLEDIYKSLLYEECRSGLTSSAQGETRPEDANTNDAQVSGSGENQVDKEAMAAEKELCKVNMSERVLHIIEEIKNINEGPFAPLSQHPIVSAIAMPFGGVGGLYLIDYFANIGV